MNDLSALIEQDLGPGKRIGAWVFWRCPFHPDDMPSFSVKNDRYYCFACQASGDAADWLVEYRRLPKGEALRLVKGNGYNAMPKPRQEDVPPFAPPGELWQESALAEAASAFDCLLNRPQGQEVRDYLARRGLTPESWLAWSLGAGRIFNPLSGRAEPAVVIPYFAGGGRALAVKYRFLNGALRYRMRKGSHPTVYGLWQPVRPILIVVEGELNAISIWQVFGDRATVVSPGGESGSRAYLLPLLKSPQFERKIVWFDKAEAVKGLARLADIALVSPTLDGQKMDANQMLRQGLLEDFLKKVLEV